MLTNIDPHPFPKHPHAMAALYCLYLLALASSSLLKIFNILLVQEVKLFVRDTDAQALEVLL
jgi:hypothetical protein